MEQTAKLRKTKANLDEMLRVGVGQINPYPEISVLFSTLARTAIQKTDRGILVVVVTDTTADTKWTTLKGVEDIEAGKWTEANQKLLATAFEVFPPNRVLVRRKGSDAIGVILAELNTIELTHLACPEASSSDDTAIVTWIKQRITKNQSWVAYVSSQSNDSDCAGVVEISNKTVKHKLITGYTPLQFTVMVAGAMAGCPLNRSLDNAVFPIITEVDNVEPTNGKFTMYNDDGKVRCKMALNSKTTFDSTWKSNTRFIKVFEGMNIVRNDIINTFKNYWLGLYINSYDNKIAFCNLVNRVYFVELAPNVLSADYDNRIFIDVEANKRFIVTEGLDPDTMSETAIKTYPTGESVFLAGDVRFSNTMINLFLEILY